MTPLFLKVTAKSIFGSVGVLHVIGLLIKSPPNSNPSGAMEQAVGLA